MTTKTQRWSYSIPSIMLGMVLAACASTGQGDLPPVSSPSAALRSSRSQDAALPESLSATSGNEKAAELRHGEHVEHEKSGAGAGTFKHLAVSWPTNASGEMRMPSDKKVGEPERESVVAGAITAVGTAREPSPFAERRASEGLDRLAGSVTIRKEKRGSVITLPLDRLVEAGDWKITASGQYGLKELALGLREQEGRTIRIQGYTDSMGTQAINEALSLRRAESVRDFLIAQGVPAENLRAEGFGAKRPLTSNASAAGRAENRRIEIVITPLP